MILQIVYFCPLHILYIEWFCTLYNFRLTGVTRLTVGWPESGDQTDLSDRTALADQGNQTDWVDQNYQI